jgi:hypothetical protein
VEATVPPGSRPSHRKRQRLREHVLEVLRELEQEGHLERRFQGEPGAGWSEWRALDAATIGR